MNNDGNYNYVKNNSIHQGYDSYENIRYSNNSNLTQATYTTSISSMNKNLKIDLNEFYSVKHNVPLRPKIDQIKYRINSEIFKFQKIFNELKNQDEEGVRKLLLSLNENNIQYTSLVCSELNKIRKTSKIIWISKVVLDILEKDIKGISSFKDLVEIFPASLSVIKSIRTMLFSYLNESEHDLRNITDLLIDVLINASQVGGYLINFKLANNKALLILEDAKFEAEDKIKSEFLSIPDPKL
ncbi:MAG: hypothetical protein R3321_09035 [Nitrososphaeraceae archaeon]|nr:hypothetical protein [Nitrososphaeraceae archaeon]